MNRTHHRWTSESLGRDMELLSFGQAGARVIAFPTSQGRFSDWEERGLVAAVAERIEGGALHLFCVDSVDSESWYDEAQPVADRVRRHVQYDRYVLDEVVPFTLSRNTSPTLVVTGASFGGYHALNFALRHPDTAQRVLSMSGLTDIRPFLGAYYDDECYFNNPCEFVAGEHDPARLEALRRLDIVLAVGRDDGLCASNECLSSVLWSKNVWHALRVWDGIAHDWPVWARMLRLYIGGHD